MILAQGRLVAHAPLDQLSAAAGLQPVVRVRTPKVEELRAAVTAHGGAARVVAADLVEITGSTPERVGQIAADLAIPVFESTTEAQTRRGVGVTRPLS